MKSWLETVYPKKSRKGLKRVSETVLKSVLKFSQKCFEIWSKVGRVSQEPRAA
jgi:hypothetical protein